MNEVSMVGVDIAKKVFQVHGVDAAGTVVVRRALRRAQVLAFFAKLPPCRVGLERVRRPTIGRVSCRSWGTRCG
jgi:transposase